MLIAVLAAVVVLLVPGGVFAWRALDGGGPQPHDVLPAEAIGYFRLDLDPSAGQKIEAFRFLNKFPVFGDATGITDDDEDIRERLIDEFAEATGCDIDFESDVEPWIGERLGGALLPPSDDDAQPGFVVALQTDDEDAADAAMDKVLACDAAGSEAFGRAYLDGYLIITDTQDNAERYAESARESSLADNDDFAEAMDLLGDPGIASVWLSGMDTFDMFSDSLGSEQIPDDMAPPMSEGDMREFQEAFSASTALAFRFDDSYAEIATVVTGDAYEELDSGGVRADLPESTAALFGFADGGPYLGNVWGDFADAYPDLIGQLEGFAGQAGLSLPDDLATAIGDSLVVTLDAEGLDPDTLTQLDSAAPLRLGLLVATDPEAARDVWERARDSAGEGGQSLDAVPLEFTDDGYVVATDEEYASALIDGGTLGDSDAYTTVVKDKDNADGVFFVNVDVVEEDVRQLLADQGLDDDQLQSVRTLQALGYSAHIQDGYVETTMRVSAN